MEIERCGLVYEIFWVLSTEIPLTIGRSAHWRTWLADGLRACLRFGERGRCRPWLLNAPSLVCILYSCSQEKSGLKLLCFDKVLHDGKWILLVIILDSALRFQI
jgi:hypothetical protein